DRVVAADGDPAELAEARESIRLAFIAALQHLPPKQRAVLLLRDVVRWHATEVAELLGTSDASVNSALQRARSTIAASNISDTDPVMPMDDAQQELLSRYVDAFERYDMESLTSLIHEDAMQSMPPFELWLSGRDEILAFWQTQGAGCAGSRLLPTVATGRPAFGQYRPSQTGEGHDPWALQILDFSDGQLVELSFFLDTETLFPLFGVPSHLPPEEAVSARPLGPCARPRAAPAWARLLVSRERRMPPPTSPNTSQASPPNGNGPDGPRRSSLA